jgi:hypothetical protein
MLNNEKTEIHQLANSIYNDHDLLALVQKDMCLQRSISNMPRFNADKYNAEYGLGVLFAKWIFDTKVSKISEGIGFHGLIYQPREGPGC